MHAATSNAAAASSPSHGGAAAVATLSLLSQIQPRTLVLLPLSLPLPLLLLQFVLPLYSRCSKLRAADRALAIMLRPQHDIMAVCCRRRHCICCYCCATCAATTHMHVALYMLPSRSRRPARSHLGVRRGACNRTAGGSDGAEPGGGRAQVTSGAVVSLPFRCSTVSVASQCNVTIAMLTRSI